MCKPFHVPLRNIIPFSKRSQKHVDDPALFTSGLAELVLVHIVISTPVCGVYVLIVRFVGGGGAYGHTDGNAYPAVIGCLYKVSYFLSFFINHPVIHVWEY